MKIPFIDIHTHHPTDSADILSVPGLFLQDICWPHEIAINQIQPKQVFDEEGCCISSNNELLSYPPEGLFSAAIHPWHASLFREEQVSRMLDQLLKLPGLFAIGETGLDKVCPADYGLQKMIFELHLEFAETHRFPVIIHAVKSWNELIPYLKKTKVPIILHGYSGGVELTRQLLPLGCCFSIGKSVLQVVPRVREAIQLIPMNRLFLETDDSLADIRDIYFEVSKILDCTPEELKFQINQNFAKLKAH